MEKITNILTNIVNFDGIPLIKFFTFTIIFCSALYILGIPFDKFKYVMYTSYVLFLLSVLWYAVMTSDREKTF